MPPPPWLLLIRFTARSMLASEAGTDANFVVTGSGNLVEVQASAEGAPFSQDELLGMLDLARKGTGRLVELQKMAIA